MELWMLKALAHGDRDWVARKVLQSASEVFGEELAKWNAARLSLTVWTHRSNGGENHYTIRAYDSAGRTVGSIHAANESGAYEGWFGNELKKSGKKKRSGTSIVFQPDKHMRLGD
ncbi:hypothetical protein K435DRAFT_880519 [Dendrothele bispora CBS 962.96]|uniref:Uncharacterized protein n=1 Tax=Dendrothele bispora (strain CBS 962.96) TaxID=1314807 RepID=A0A4S8KJC7_DENBC|nr:hypothetical protein K435DRAFT_880519 [Dendrothele bispora CBS 962.96]